MHRLCFGFLSLTLGLVSRRVDAQRDTMIVVRSRGMATTPIRLETFVYRPTGNGPFPLVIVNHGSAGGAPAVSLPAPALARYFVQRGYEVIVPMRRGRGRSIGVSREYEDRHCDLAAWGPGLDDALDDITTAIDFGRTLPEVTGERVILVGVSRGGFLSLAYAARGARRARIASVVNFVGSWVAQRQDGCPQDFNAVSFTQFGRAVRIPTLWLYGDQDPYNATPDILTYVTRFRTGGGDAQFTLFTGVPGNGHALPDAPGLWADSVDVFLRRLRDDVPAASRVHPNER